MSKVKISVFVLCILLILSAAVWYFYSQLPPPLEQRLANARETAKWVKAIQWDRVKDSMSREEFEKGPAAIHCNKILEFLKDRNTLEEPHLIQAMITAPRISMDLDWLDEESKKNLQREILSLDLYWLEDGFSTEGVRITHIKEDRKETYELPIISKFNFWDAESRRMHRETASRFGGFPVKIGGRYDLENLNDSDESIIVFPPNIVEAKVWVSIYDKKGRESDPIQLEILEDARQVILQEIGPHQD